MKVKRPQQAFFLTLMGYERKTSLSIVRVGGRGRSSSLRGWWPFSCHIGLICDFFGYFSTAGKLQFPYQIKCSTYLYSSTYFHLLQRILNSILNLCRLFRTFRIPFFFAHLLFYSCQLLTWLFLCFFFLLAFSPSLL